MTRESDGGLGGDGDALATVNRREWKRRDSEGKAGKRRQGRLVADFCIVWMDEGLWCGVSVRRPEPGGERRSV